VDGTHLIIALAAAGGLGAVVGLERQVSSHDAAITGARTFALYGMWGTGAAFAGAQFGGVAFGALALAFGALLAASHLTAAPVEHDPGTTTEAAAVAVFVAGTLTWFGEFIPAVILTVTTAAILGAKAPVHRMAARISMDDRRSALQFAVITGVVLPLVPDEPMGPYGALNPRHIWLMVVFVSAIGLLGYIGLRVAGSRGVGVSGILGGLVSSTAVTLGFGRLARAEPSLRPALSAGVIGASTLMFPRMLVYAIVLAPALARETAPILLGITVLIGLSAWLRLRSQRGHQAPPTPDVRNPLTLKVALQFGVLYGVIVLVAEILINEGAGASLPLLGFFSGVADVDAITLTAATLVRDGLAADMGARVMLLAAAANTLFKAGLVRAVGTREIGRDVGVVLVPAGLLTGVAAFLV
jgi:uncharacterized membrane protein (DUF4010 family)